MAEHLGGFEQAVLLSLVRLGDEAYGRAIMKDVEARLATRGRGRRGACDARPAATL
jgi:hypothetical protein